MANRAAIIADRAVHLCGARYRRHGRDAVHGFDCIGLAADCLAAAGLSCAVPTGYALRGGSLDQITARLGTAGFQSLPADQMPIGGDIVLVQPCPLQWHIMIKAGDGFVHAHAGLRRVVFAPGKSPWPIRKIFRIAED
ncbi:MAG: peptidoglycan endopeptidase [Parasphingorhabdus sp.]|uniref:peptidoglycan endopeptidase n=1 Tax=Parasphingorhabdus sp. TaxID=2709688 RepID=UPI0032997743